MNIGGMYAPAAFIEQMTVTVFPLSSLVKYSMSRLCGLLLPKGGLLRVLVPLCVMGFHLLSVLLSSLPPCLSQSNC